jgi:hypothetical protein
MAVAATIGASTRAKRISIVCIGISSAGGQKR